MSDTDLQDRLRESAKAFDGLLSLIPAQAYYGEDTSDQWKRKKQSKAEKKAAKLGKLDPDSEKNWTAKEVMEERARNKRKLQELEEATGSGGKGENDDSDSFELEGIEKEQPLKRRRTEDHGNGGDTDTDADADAYAYADAGTSASQPQPTPAAASRKEQKNLLKQQRRLEKKGKKEEKAHEARKAGEAAEGEAAEKSKEKKSRKQAEEAVNLQELDAAKESIPRPSAEVDEQKAPSDDDLAPIHLPGLANNDEEDAPSLSTSHSSEAGSPVFDVESLTQNKHSLEPSSTTTSIASTAAVPPSEKPKHAKLPSGSTDAFRARLAARIEELRKARKADPEDGRPPRTRQELIESRREKQAQRRVHKKEARRLAKEEADRKREEALASARTSPGSFMSPLHNAGGGGGSDDGNNANNHFAFGRIAFADGAQMSQDLSYVKEKGAAGQKKKGPSDPKTALAKLEAQKRRVAAMDEDKRKEVLEKETWLAARRRAEGEKVRDDEQLLRRTVKRKESAKKKSEREWGERKAGVEKSIRERQKKREDNLRKRREEKALGKMGKKGGKKAGLRKASSGKKARPGFEGTGLGGGKRK